MKPAHMVAVVLIPFVGVAAVLAATWFRTARDLFFFAMVSLAVLAERMDVNFFSEAWYRGHDPRDTDHADRDPRVRSAHRRRRIWRRGPGPALVRPGSLGLMLT